MLAEAKTLGVCFAMSVVVAVVVGMCSWLPSPWGWERHGICKKLL